MEHASIQTTMPISRRIILGMRLSRLLGVTQRPLPDGSSVGPGCPEKRHRLPLAKHIAVPEFSVEGRLGIMHEFEMLEALPIGPRYQGKLVAKVVPVFLIEGAKQKRAPLLHH